MKKIIYLLIPVILVAIIVFVFVKIFIFSDLGKGALQVTSQPFSKVYLDDAYIGTTPLSRHEASNMLRSGEYTLKLVPIDGKTKEYLEKVTITKGVLTVVDRKFGPGATSEGSVISLEKIADNNKSELLVMSLPNTADVYLDGNFQGNTPYFKNSVTDSDHSLRIKKDGYKDKNLRIRTPKGYKLKAVVYLGLLDDITKPTESISPKLSGSLSPLSITPQKKTKIIILDTPNGFLRVRSNPSTLSAEISRVSTGDIFEVIDEQTGWFKIKLTDNSEGWVSADYAKAQ